MKSQLKLTVIKSFESPAYGVGGGGGRLLDKGRLIERGVCYTILS